MRAPSGPFASLIFPKDARWSRSSAWLFTKFSLCGKQILHPAKKRFVKRTSVLPAGVCLRPGQLCSCSPFLPLLLVQLNLVKPYAWGVWFRTRGNTAMRKLLCALLVIATAVPAFAADKFVGTWKMNAQKSSGPEVDTDGMLVAVDEGGMQSITVTGKAPDGSSFKTQFSVPMHGGPGKIVEAPYNGVRAKAFTASTSDFTFTTDNKPGMHVRSVLSEDGKVMTTTRQVMSGPAKPGTYTDVWEKE
jgi:hypothetical protein